MLLTKEEVFSKSADILKDLEPVIALGFQTLIERCYDRGVAIRLPQGYRSIPYQNSLYSQGRTQAQMISVGLGSVKAQPNLPKVTNARGGNSYHNYRVAGDFVLMYGGYDMKYDYNNNGVSDWMEVVVQAKLLGFEWGGDWSSFKDYPHFQMTFGLSTAQLFAGRRPSASQIQSAYDKINKLREDDSEMTAVEELNKKVEELSKAFGDIRNSNLKLQERVDSVEKMLNVSKKDYPTSEWATGVLQKAKAAGIIQASNDKNEIEVKVLQMILNTGVADPAVQKLIKDTIAKGGELNV